MAAKMRHRLIKWIQKNYNMNQEDARKYYNSRTPEQKRNAALEMQKRVDRTRDFNEQQRAEAGAR